MSAESFEIDCHTVNSRLADDDDQFILLDCREQAEHNHVRLPQSTLIPMSEIAIRTGDLEEYRDQEIVVYCHHGIRSLDVAAWLRQQGYNARSMTGGIDRWSLQIDSTLLRY